MKVAAAGFLVPSCPSHAPVPAPSHVPLMREESISWAFPLFPLTHLRTEQSPCLPESRHLTAIWKSDRRPTRGLIAAQPQGFAFAHQPVQSLFPPLINAWLSANGQRRLSPPKTPPETAPFAIAPRGLGWLQFAFSISSAGKNLRADQAETGRRSRRRVRQAFSSEQAETPIPESDNAVTC